MRDCDRCHERPARFVAVTNGYNPESAGDWQIRTKAETTQDALCVPCLIDHISNEGICAYHMVYAVEIASIPDGVDFDNLLRESVKECAKYRRMTPAEFMRLGVSEQLSEQDWTVKDK